MFRHLGLLSCKNLHNILKESCRYNRINTRRIQRKKRQLNPGVQLQSKLLNDELHVEDLDELESDFMDVNQTHRQHVKEVDVLKEHEKRLIVKQKYFKQISPNFLTWNDKQQIRYLHNTDPEEWTIDKLADGFPALPETIIKVAKATWTKTSEAKIKNHDASVATNWWLYKSGKLDLPPNLSKHLGKFTDRQLNFRPVEIPVPADKPPQTTKHEGEFSAIITSYERIKNKSNATSTQSQTNVTERKPKNETYLTTTPENFTDKKSTTLRHLRRKLQSEAIVGENLSSDDSILLQELQRRDDVANRSENPIVDVSNLKTVPSTRNALEPEKNFSHLNYPEKIVIPKDKMKKGCTYKLNDCFYDSDGLFLYRVPGMNN